MRALEIVLSFANALALAGCAVRRFRGGRPTVFAGLMAASSAGLQALLEGPRWQMVPAYALAAVLLLVGLVGIFWADRIRVAARAGERAGARAAVSGIGLGTLALALSIALPIALPVFGFPKPTGPFAIGTETLHWIDTGRRELFSSDPEDRRELVARVWYPARDGPSAPRASYMEDADLVTIAMARIVHLPSFLLSQLRYVTTHAVRGAAVADGSPTYPVLIFLSGLGGFSGSNTFQTEELVSRGYVVVGLDQPGGSAGLRLADGRTATVPPREQIQALIQQSTSPASKVPILNGHALPDGIIPYFAQDLSFSIDQLTALNHRDPKDRRADPLAGRLDLESLGVFGISLGAIVTGEACLRDARVKAALMMDAAMPADVVRTGLRQPCIWISRPASDMRLERSRSGGWPESSITETLATMWAVFDAHKPGSAYYLDMPGMFHVNFTDAPFWSPLTVWLGLTGPVDGARMWRIVNAYTVAFFDEYLKGRQEPLLDGPAGQRPEVRLSRR
jgi:predicted dienelactone hydrolase